jgi:alpha-galactosidase
MLTTALPLQLLVPALAWAMLLLAVPASGGVDDDFVWLDELNLSVIDQEWGQAQAAKSVDGRAISIGGVTYARGVGSHANAEWEIDLFGDALQFIAAVGVNDEVGELGSVRFRVFVDGREAAASEIIRGGQPARTLKVDLTGARRMTLVVEDGGDGINYDHADWAQALIMLRPGATRRPASRVLPPVPDPIIASGFDVAPAIHAPHITGATTGRPFLFRIPATGERPMSFRADGLPDGLELDPDTGIITGRIAEDGRTDVTITASNEHGSATSTLTIVGGWHTLALTPPMGWNSWNVWGTSVDAEKVMAAADWMVASGLADVGFQYINIDDAWEAGRDAEGNIQTNEKFPDMKALADYVHSRGLKLGIYSSPGPHTCAGYEGSYQHELQDAQTFATWGIDLLKYDWCGYSQVTRSHEQLYELAKPYFVMRDALDRIDRDIVYSICQYGMGDVSRWGEVVGGNYWRTTGDIVDTWGSMSGIGFSQNGLEQYAGPGHWNDPDMLVVGDVGWGPNLHPTRLTKHEQITHITLWSMLAAPLLIGCDLSSMDQFTIDILTNPEVLAVSQDPLGRQGWRLTESGRTEVWGRPLADGTWAIALFNRGRSAAAIRLPLDALGYSGPQPVRDLWRRQDLDAVEGTIEMSVERHGAVMLKVGVPRR